MIPGMSVLPRSELVRVFLAIRDWTLSDAVDAVHVVAVKLTEAVPVDGSPIVAILVSDMDDNLITPAGLNDGPWIGAVQSYSVDLGLTIGPKVSLVDGEPVLLSTLAIISWPMQNTRYQLASRVMPKGVVTSSVQS